MATRETAPYKPRRAESSSARSSDAVVRIGDFQRMEHIGKGSFAEVYRGIHIVRSLFVLNEVMLDVKLMLTAKHRRNDKPLPSNP